ncbi:hypothetical protein OKA04_24110 [Luteolibacter flavescens]|uniref:Calcium-binding protein n=1 Tax=Luteolibacter flavescens TaxID=1859460 RepID=A0ABT3FXW2_9BACT|nr:hypothetical protein [Luteolibacter flavescens]MCW1887845.1 hypothetical protein [Luteolibacter flavescens]
MILPDRPNRTPRSSRRAALAILPLCTGLAGAADFPIGVNFSDNTAFHLTAAETAGAEVVHANWNNCIRWGNPLALNNSNGVATPVTVKWDASGAWQTSTAAITGGNNKLMNAYLDSNGAANTTPFDGVFGTGDDKPVVLVTKMDEWMTANNLTSYSVVIYSDGDSSAGDRATKVWLANTLPNSPTNGGDPGLGSDLTSRVNIIDQANYGTAQTFTRVTGTSGVGNYTVFSGLTAPSFYIRIDEAGSNPWRAPLNGFQIIGTDVVEIPDADGDGLPDFWESNHGLDPNDDGSVIFENGASGDPDGDGRTNAQEYNGGVNSTNPQKADTDDDGLDDGQEFLLGTNPLDADSDDDDLPDGWEVDNELDPLDDGSTNVDFGTNGDPDGDGLPNVQEYARKTDPHLADTDGDGYSDLVENGTGVWDGEFFTGTNPLVADTDGDGIKDGDENPELGYLAGVRSGTDPNKSDTDGDGQNDRWEFLLGTDPTLDTSALPTVALNNPSFELPDAAGTFLTQVPTDWSIADAPEADEVFVENITSAALTGGQGLQYAGVQQLGNYIYQTTSVPFAANTTYIVDVASGYRAGFMSGLVEFGLYSSNAIGTPVSAYPGSIDANGVSLNSGNPDADGVLNRLRDASALTTIGSGRLGRVFSFTTGSNPPAGNVVAYIRHANGFRVVFDNIRIIAVPNTIDVDADGLPDAWELAHNLSPRDNGSISVENGPNGDLDGDGSTNAQEFAAGSDPHDYDTDNDGLSDGVETGTGIFVGFDNTGTSPIKFDTDGDGYGDNEEVTAGTDPNNASSYPGSGSGTTLKVTSLSKVGAVFSVTVEGLETTKTYTLARSTTLNGFAPIGTTVTGVTTHTFSDPAAPGGRAFYRVQEVTPP